MKWARHIMVLGLLLAACLGTAQTPTSSHAPAPASHKGPQKSFIDFVFSRINSKDIDYGQRIEDLRSTALEATVLDFGFWTDIVAAGVLGMTFIIIYWQYRQNQRVRFSTTRIVTGYRNELAVARDHIAKLSAEYARLKTVADEQVEAALVSRPPASKRENASGNGAGKGASSSAQSAVEQHLREDNDKLNQQLRRANETIGNLRQQTGTLTQRLEEEQQKNRRLRGE